jgi:hypothetical protein
MSASPGRGDHPRSEDKEADTTTPPTSGEGPMDAAPNPSEATADSVSRLPRNNGAILCSSGDSKSEAVLPDSELGWTKVSDRAAKRRAARTRRAPIPRVPI